MQVDEPWVEAGLKKDRRNYGGAAAEKVFALDEKRGKRRLTTLFVLAHGFSRYLNGYQAIDWQASSPGQEKVQAYKRAMLCDCR